MLSKLAQSSPQLWIVLWMWNFLKLFFADYGACNVGKCFFLVGRVNACSIETNAVCKLGETYCSPVLFCELEVRCLFGISRDFLIPLLCDC